MLIRKEIVSICKDFLLVPVNHMCYKDVTCDGGITYRQKDQLVSQIDWALISENFISQIVDFKILNYIPFPSNHAPISLTISCHGALPKSLLDHAMFLNYYSTTNKPISAKPIRLSQIDTQKFQECLLDPLELFEQIAEGTDNMCSIITEALHSACKSAAYRTTNSNAQTRTADQRWKTLVELGDPKKIWKAID